MQVLQLKQGSPEWHIHRATHFNASDAPAMMACSTYMTRSQLIHKLATGINAEVDAGTQRRFDDGHRFEALALPLAEKILDEDLSPVVGVLGKLSASFDGLNASDTIAFEHKSLNDTLRAAMVEGCTGADLPEMYQVQMEHQCAVSGAGRVLFMASKWAGDDLVEERHCWYTPNPALRAQILAGWEALEADVAAYVPVEIVPKVVAEPMQSLPAVTFRLNGAVTVVSNLTAVQRALETFIGRMVAKPATDQEFANAESECKALKGVEDALDAAEEMAINELSEVQAWRQLKKTLHALARSTRLAREKLVEAEKKNRKEAIVNGGHTALRAHFDALNANLGRPYMPDALARADFGGCISGMKKLDNMEEKVKALLVSSKLAATEKAKAIQQNLDTLRELASNHKTLFADTHLLVLKQNDDLRAMVQNRIAEHQRDEAQRQEQIRAQIRREEEERANRLAQEQQAEQQRQAEATARQAALDAEAAAKTGIAQGQDAGELPAPLAEALTETAAHVRASIIAGIDAGQVIAAAAAAPRSAEPPEVATPDTTGPASLLIGAINARLGYVVSAAFLAELGFEPARVEGARRFYRDSDLPRIGRAIAAHTISATQLQTA